MIDNDIPYVMSTYGIYRGFVLIEPKNVPQGSSLYAAWLDGAEYFGNYIRLQEIKQRQKFDLLITGASAVSKNGVRFGKGHGFFDLEWGMFSEIGVADESTKIIALVHDCQFVQEDLKPNKTDILVDFIVTPTAVHRVQKGEPGQKGFTGNYWKMPKLKTHRRSGIDAMAWYVNLLQINNMYSNKIMKRREFIKFSIATSTIPFGMKMHQLQNPSQCKLPGSMMRNSQVTL